MFMLAAMVGVAVFWLWFFPPDGLAPRHRTVLLTLACVVFVGVTWTSVRLQQEMVRARQRAVELRREAISERDAAVERIRREEAESR